MCEKHIDVLYSKLEMKKYYYYYIHFLLKKIAYKFLFDNDPGHLQI